jgi:hypothetical protein
LRSRPLFALLALLLLFVQQGAVLHEMGHVFESSRYGQHDRHSGGPTDVCDQCAAYVPGGAALPPSPFDFNTFTPTAAPLVPGKLAVIPARPLAAYQSRAPPHYLV